MFLLVGTREWVRTQQHNKKKTNYDQLGVNDDEDGGSFSPSSAADKRAVNMRIINLLYSLAFDILAVNSTKATIHVCNVETKEWVEMSWPCLAVCGCNGEG